MTLFCNIGDLKNESDVEQMFIYPFLTTLYPSGCGYQSSDILTKTTIRSYKLKKASKIIYRPDYIIQHNGIPFVVVEAKSPSESLDNAYHEARLYANEMNSVQFKHNVNPCNKLIVTNGKMLLAGFVDSSYPVIEIEFKDIVYSNEKFSKLLEFCCKKTIVNDSLKLITKIRGNSIYKKPVGVLGGEQTQNRVLRENEFGRTLSLDYSNILEPQDENDYASIVENMYVSSERRNRNVDPIVKTIRKLRLPSVDDATLISHKDSYKITDGINMYYETNEDKYSLIILIGNVGSGKSTFIHYIKNIALKDTMYKSIDWLIANMNNAPLDKDLIYKWLVKSLIEEIQRKYENIKYYELDFLMKLYSKRIDEFSEGIGKLLKDDPVTYKKELFNVIKEAQNDLFYTLKCLITYFKINMKTTFIVAFDNVDEGTDVFQRLLFEVAQWFKKEYSCVIFLTMRDITYNKYKNDPPLDTVVKSLVFRIDPPDLLAVLQKRLEYIAYKNKETTLKDWKYQIGTGMNVIIKKDEISEYFKNILVSIRNDNIIKSIFYKVTGKNIRSGIELFINFIKSGHINSNNIFKLEISEGESGIPHSLMMNAVLRGNRQYYNDDDAIIKNLFASNFRDSFVDPFVRVDILMWCDKKFGLDGPSGDKGYHDVNDLINELSLLGHDTNVVEREIEFLEKNMLVEIDDNNINSNEVVLVKLTSFGKLHLDLLRNSYYLAACSENIYYRKIDIATQIRKRISCDTHLSINTAINNINDMLTYLKEYKEDFLAHPDRLLEDINTNSFDLSVCFEVLNDLMTKNEYYKHKIFYTEDIVECLVTNTQVYGIFVSVDLEASGFISNSNLGEYLDLIEVGDCIKAEIIEYKDNHKRYSLRFIEML